MVQVSGAQVLGVAAVLAAMAMTAGVLAAKADIWLHRRRFSSSKAV